jgi:hypothetical protein
MSLKRCYISKYDVILHPERSSAAHLFVSSWLSSL